MSTAAERMQFALGHRGPDDAGWWSSDHAVLAHRRLSILDLSSAARQPMSTPDGRLTICFNGEIYNFKTLRSELEAAGVPFLTHSDTEVILRLYERDGAGCVKHLRGMFAFAIWDEANRTAFLARDPLGIKPLYVHTGNGTLAFASELRALCGSGLFPPSLRTEAVQRYFETGSVPEPLTLVNEARLLEAGHCLTWKEGAGTDQCYWRLELGATFTGDPVAHTREALIDSVRHHFVSDVPVGVFLSGGIDSTALLALANVTGHQGISAFSISVDDPAADESPIARRTAAHFGARYEELRLDAGVARGLFASFLNHLDQPSIDGLNTFTVSALAREHGMKVVLSGLGGDELFAGYSSFATIPKMLRWRRILRAIPCSARVLDHGRPKHRRMADLVRSAGSVQDAFSTLRGIFSKQEAATLTRWITGCPVDASGAHVASRGMDAATVADQISALEITRFMRNQLLRDSDVMSMSHGLELRVPFVDRVLLEAVAPIPAEKRLQPSKALLTQAIPEVPYWVVNQKKRGFLFPYEKWLEGDWGDAFRQATVDVPVPIQAWYQTWSVFILRTMMEKLHCSPGTTFPSAA